VRCDYNNPDDISAGVVESNLLMPGAFPVDVTSKLALATAADHVLKLAAGASTATALPFTDLKNPRSD
jgi:hypothetical protein